MGKQNNAFQILKKMIDDHNHFVVISHIYTDGDALGAVMAFYHYLKSLGKKVEAIIPGSLPARYDFLKTRQAINRHSKSRLKKIIERADVILIVDISALERMDEWYAPVMASKAKKVCIDHHPDMCEQMDLKIIDVQRIATCEIVYDFFKTQGIKITDDMALALYTGILSDSGGFRFEGTSGKTLEIAAQLARKNIDPAWVYRQVYEYSNKNQLRFWGHVLAGLQSEGVIDWAVVSRETLQKFNVNIEELNGLIDIIRRDAAAQIFAMFVEKKNGEVMVGLRSKNGFDVGQLARRFGGGGHFHAAGFSSSLPLREVVQMTLEQIKQDQVLSPEE
ncbi:DHH family phosphoesterase [Caldithrix abyssi]